MTVRAQFLFVGLVCLAAGCQGTMVREESTSGFQPAAWDEFVSSYGDMRRSEVLGDVSMAGLVLGAEPGGHALQPASFGAGEKEAKPPVISDSTSGMKRDETASQAAPKTGETGKVKPNQVQHNEKQYHFVKKYLPPVEKYARDGIYDEWFHKVVISRYLDLARSSQEWKVEELPQWQTAVQAFELAETKSRLTAVAEKLTAMIPVQEITVSFARGDLDGDGSFTEADLYAFNEWHYHVVPPRVLESLDTNDDGVIDLRDYDAVHRAVYFTKTTPRRERGSFSIGDVNVDGRVDAADHALLKMHLAAGMPLPGMLDAGDMNQDGYLDDVDRIVLARKLSIVSDGETDPGAKSE